MAKSSDLIKNLTSDLAAYSIMPQPTTLPPVPFVLITIIIVITEMLQIVMFYTLCVFAPFFHLC
jgi:hypothetical protein